MNARYRSSLVSGAILLLATAQADAAVQTKTIDYEHNGTTLQGFFAWDDAVEGQRPAGEIAADVLQQNRPLADGVDAGADAAVP